MGVFDQAGGGGNAPLFTPNDEYALDKPYDLSGDPSAEKMAQLDEMLLLLFKASTRNRGRLTDAEAAIAAIPAPAGITSIFFAIKYVLTDAQIKTLNSVPVELIAGVTDTFIVPLGIDFDENTTAGAYTSTRSMTLQYANGTTDMTTPLTLVQAATARHEYRHALGTGSAVNHGTNSPYGQAIRMVATGDNTAGNAANTVTVRVGYYLVSSL